MMEWRRVFWGMGLLFAVVLLIGLAGCEPDFPNCENDEHCADSDEGQDQDRTYCVNGTCQQCREDEHCDFPYEECQAGECVEIEDACEPDTEDEDCEPHERCVDNRCEPECEEDADCEADEVCDGGECVEEPECTTDADCAEDEMCENEECVDDPDFCALDPVYFDFDSADLRSEARDELDDYADCIEEQDMTVELEGHTDERGTEEYNIALGERRATSVRDYLEDLGVSSDQLDIISYGEERLERQCGEQGSDSCHQENRRVEFDRE